MCRAFPGELDADLHKWGLTLREIQAPGFPVETWLVLIEVIADDIGTITGARLAGFLRPTPPSELVLLIIARSLVGDAVDFLLPLPKPEQAPEVEEVTALERRQAERELEASIIIQE